ncbi:sulfatase [Niabella beijingensis]|uniref:sulfatase n=1 Tax=Niabella beijingensis TaxID=2872700 RepID=UPI001CC07730|nr:sulfatase [Niabella beijingensis]MBZ4187560.1 sulfatase [Niabella beijingensis]
MNPVPCIIKRTKLFLLMLLLLYTDVLYGQHQERSRHPNILFIAVDDLRPELGAYGRAYMHTPHMDRLAREGRVFLNHYVNVPTCGASRYSMLTGRLPQTPAALSNDAFEKLTAGKPAAEEPESFVELFRRNGYYTVGIGKISHSPDGNVYGYNQPVSDKRELPHSWDAFYFDHGKWQTGWNAFFGYAGGENRQGRKNEVRPYEHKDVPDTAYPDGLTAQLAVEQLAVLKEKDQPFLLAVGFFKPHLPFTAPEKYWDLYDERKIPLSASPGIPAAVNEKSLHNSNEFNQYKQGEEKPSLKAPVSDAYARKLRHAYFAAVSYVDTQIGKVLEALKQAGLDKNTVVVLWGDHGWHLGDERVWGKHTLSDYSLRSPLILRVPGMPAAGMSSPQVVQSVDIYPTLLQLAHISPKGILDGRSLYPELFRTGRGHATVARSYFNRGISLRTSRYRLTKYYRQEQPVTELYDYTNDPYETRNLAASFPGVVDSLLPVVEHAGTTIQQYWKPGKGSGKDGKEQVGRKNDQ